MPQTATDVAAPNEAKSNLSASAQECMKRIPALTDKLRSEGLVDGVNQIMNGNQNLTYGDVVDTILDFEDINHECITTALIHGDTKGETILSNYGRKCTNAIKDAGEYLRQAEPVEAPQPVATAPAPIPESVAPPVAEAPLPVAVAPAPAPITIPKPIPLEQSTQEDENLDDLELESNFIVQVTAVEEGHHLSLEKKIASLTDYDLIEAKTLLKDLPAVIDVGLTEDEANDIAFELEESGATVNIEQR